MNKLTSIYFSEYSLLDILGLDSLEAVVGRVEGGEEKPHKRVDRPRHLGKERNERFDLKPSSIELERKKGYVVHVHLKNVRNSMHAMSM